MPADLWWRSVTDVQWIRWRFHADYDDYRPIEWPPPGPYWCSGYAGDESYSTLIAYLPRGVAVTDYWPEATELDSTLAVDGIVFTDRFPQPKWWPLDG